MLSSVWVLCLTGLFHSRGTRGNEKYRFRHLHMTQGTKHTAFVPSVGRGVMAIGAAELLGIDFKIVILQAGGAAGHDLGSSKVSRIQRAKRIASSESIDQPPISRSPIGLTRNRWDGSRMFVWVTHISG